MEVMDLMTALQASLDKTKTAQRRGPERKTAAKKASESDTRTASSPASP
jgi:non-homologous end joining protein Ku